MRSPFRLFLVGSLGLLLATPAWSRATMDEIFTRQQMGLKGPVKTLRVFAADQNSAWSPSNDEEVYSFDQSGTLVKVEKFTHGNIANVRTYTYDPGHVHLSIVSRDNVAADPHQTNFNEIATQQLKLDPNGRILEITFFDRDSETEILRRSYDPQGRLTEESSLNVEGKPLFQKEVRYADDGQTAEAHARGLLLRDAIEAPDPEEHSIATYDASGRVLQVVKDGPKYKGATITVTYAYDPAGRVSEEKARSSMGSMEKTLYTYDAQGNVLKRDYSSTKGTADLEEYVYTYDARGNWITSRKTRTLKLPEQAPPDPTIEVVTRKIEYFQ